VSSPLRLLYACLDLREKTPRHDYDGCIQIIVKLVNRIEQETGQSAPVGIGIPGSLEPKSRLGKGASSTWLLGRPNVKTGKANGQERVSQKLQKEASRHGALGRLEEAVALNRRRLECP